VKGHVPERDGILACLLAVSSSPRAEARGFDAPPGALRRVGTFVTRRVNYRLEPSEVETLQKRLEQPPGNVAGWRSSK